MKTMEQLLNEGPSYIDLPYYCVSSSKTRQEKILERKGRQVEETQSEIRDNDYEVRIVRFELIGNVVRGSLLYTDNVTKHVADISVEEFFNKKKRWRFLDIYLNMPFFGKKEMADGTVWMENFMQKGLTPEQEETARKLIEN